MKNIKLLALPIIFTIIGCTDGISEKQKLAAIEQDKSILAFTCEGYARHETAYGDLQNNVWNAQAAEGFDWTQCLSMRTLKGKTQYGWYWQWPEDGDKVYAQPQITLGNSPWLDHNVVKPNYPIALNNLDNLHIDYDINISTEGELNLASTLWLTRSNTIQTKIDRSSIAVEMMIWTYASDDFYDSPAGENVAEITLNGIEWEVWLNKNWHDTSSQNDNTWTYLAFRAVEPALDTKFNAAAMLRYAIEQKYIQPNLFIADIQLGTEVMSGTGQVWLNRYQVDVKLIN